MDHRPTLALAVLALAGSAAGQTICFQRITDAGSINPYGVRPALHDGTIAFLGRDGTTGIEGIYTAPADGSGPISVIADLATIAPNQPDTFFTAFWNPDIFAGQVVFAARYDGTGIDGIYLGDGETVTTLVDGPADNQDALGAAGVTWETNVGGFSTPWFKPFDGTAFPVVSHGDPLPGGGTLVDIDPHPPTLRNGVIGLAAYVSHSTGLDGGVYLYDIASARLNLVANWTVTMPGRTELFDYFSAVDCDGATVVLVGKSGLINFGGHQGLYTAPAASPLGRAAPLTLVAEMGDPAPGGGTFNTFDSVAIDGETLVFKASFEEGGQAIFGRFGTGPIFRIATLGDEIDGIVPETLDFNFRGLDGDTIVFRGSLGPPPGGGLFEYALFSATLDPQSGVPCPDPNDPPDGGPTNACRQWMDVPGPDAVTGASARDVEVLAEDDVWVAGGAGFTAHFDGSGWTTHVAPTVEGAIVSLESIASAGGETWAVGNYNGPTSGTVRAATFRFADGGWTHVPSPNPHPTQNWLMGVEVLGPGLAYAVGFTGASPQDFLMLQWNGVAWSAVALPDDPTADIDVLRGVSGSGPTDVWAVGYAGIPNEYQAVIFHFDGSSWTRLEDVPQPLSNPSLYDVVAIRPDLAWAVGDKFVSALGHLTLAMRWNGVEWAPILTPNPGIGWNFLFGVAGVDDAHVYATGYHYYGAVNEPIALTWDADSGTFVGHDLEMTGYSTSAWAAGALPSGEGLAVGSIGYFGGTQPDTFIRRFGKPAGPSDVNCDDIVDVLDLVEVVLHWGPCPSGFAADIDCSSAVDVGDLVRVILDWD